MRKQLQSIQWRVGTICGWLALLFLTSACSFFGSRPQDLRGEVRCQVQTESTAQPLRVQVVLDQTAVEQRSTFEVVRKVLVPSTSDAEAVQLQVDVGMATGAITGCGTFTDTLIHIDITGQMISYPSWISIGTRATDNVILTIQDAHGNNLVEPMQLAPYPDRFRVRWID